MDEKKVILEMLQAAKKLAEDANEMQEKQFNKRFYSIGRDADLKDFLGCLTKADLDTIRKNLGLKGISNAKKSDLVDILNAQLKLFLPAIISRLIQEDYKLLVKIIKNGGSIEYKKEYMESFLYLREYGILTGAIIEKRKCLLMVSDVFDEIKNILNKLEVIEKMKLNEKAYRIVKGLLFYYGIINMYQLHSKINFFMGTDFDMVTMNDLIFELQKRDNSIKLQGKFWCHEKVSHYDFIVDEVNKRPNLEYLEVTTDMLLKAGQDNFKEWNKFDVNFCNYLKGNFEISNSKAEEYVNNLKLGFKNGEDFLGTMNSLSRTFAIKDFKMAQEIAALLQEVYNSSRQWLLKGNSPNEIQEESREQFQPLPKNNTAIEKRKIGRNDLCPCGSGKKHKKCCLK